MFATIALVVASITSSEVMFDDCSLSELAKASTHVVLAAKAKPASVSKLGQIDSRTSRPFPYLAERWKVLKTLKSPDGSPSIDTIQVLQADENTLESLAAEGKSKSFSVRIFRDGRKASMGKDTLILFLGEPNNRGEFSYSAMFATLPPLQESKLRPLLARTR